MKKLEFGIKPEFTWSASRLERYLSCPYSYYLQYVKRPRAKIDSNGPFAIGKFLHRRAEQFYNDNLEPKYKSAESFANAAVGMWKRFEIKTNKSGGQNIRWKSEDEKWILMNEIKDICKTFYEKYANEPPPLITEYNFNFILGNRNFIGTFDEIRKGGVIRDHKSDRYLPNEKRMKSNLQFTIYALAFSCLSRNKRFALKHGVPKDIVDSLDSEKYHISNFISEFITLEFHHLRTGEILKTNRTNQHFYDLWTILNNVESQIKQKQFTPNRKNCGYCLYDDLCDIVIKEKPKQLSFFDHGYTEKPKKEPKTLRIRFPRKKKAKAISS